MSGPTIELTPGQEVSDVWVRLSVVSGPHAGAAWTFDRPVDVTLGREAPANLIFDQEPAFSRQHCLLRIDPPSVELIDQRSRNGTIVNGIPVASASLKTNDYFGVGETKLRVEVFSDDGESAHPVPVTMANAHSSVPVRVDPTARLFDKGPSIEITRAASTRKTKPDQVGSGESPTKSLPDVGKSDHGLSHDPLAGPEGTNRRERVPGEFVGSYELLDRLGSGGMAVVYRCRHRRTKGIFALKLLRSDLPPSDKQLQLFVREAGIMTQLTHPRIVKAFEFGIDGRTPFLVLEFVKAVDLIDLLKLQTLTQQIRTSIWIISRVLEAVHYLHAQGVVHRDIKPGNVLAYRVEHRLHVKLADFGLAKFHADAGFSGLTKERSVRGTLAYMSPEQFRNSRDTRPQDDLYSCGATLYRLLVGRLPNMILQPDDTLAALDETDLPPSLSQVISRSISPEVGQRFTTATDFLRALADV